jgi:hypothetical protein
LSVIDWTSGFHSGHVVGSDQICHAAWGLAAVSTERSLLAKAASLYAFALPAVPRFRRRYITPATMKPMK